MAVHLVQVKLPHIRPWFRDTRARKRVGLGELKTLTYSG